jgi:hypothetical protein
MGECYPTRPRSCRPFVVTPYIVGTDGQLVAALPDCCPTGRVRGERGCRIARHDERARKTGPQHALCVAVCGLHDTAFTLYPPGYAPYRRQSVLRVSPEGAAVRGEDPTRLGDFAGTVFEAAVDASEGRRWEREPGPTSPERWWSTQRRHLALAAALAGVAAETGDRVRESIAAVLSVETLTLRKGSQARGYRAIGRAVREVLERLRGGARRALHLLVCGHLIGHWGEPMLWDAEREVLERSPFCCAGMGAPG